MLVICLNGCSPKQWVWPLLLMLVCNTSLLSAALEMARAAFAGFMAWAFQPGWSSWMLAGALGYALITLAVPAIKLVRSRGGIRGLARHGMRGIVRSYIRRLQGQDRQDDAVRQAAREREQQQRQNDRRDAVSAALQKLPVERHMMADELQECCSHGLKARLARRGVDCSAFLEKAELVARLTEDGGSSAVSCCVCCESYASGDTVRVLGCTHRFHLECVDQWLYKACELRRSPACPLCNTAVVPPEPQPTQAGRAR